MRFLIDRLLPRQSYLMGFPDGGGTVRNGVYWTNLGSEVHLGKVDGGSTQKLHSVKPLFERADMQPDVQDNILHWLWLHNAMSTPIWVGFAKYKATKPFLKDRPLLKQCSAATRESIDLYRLRGVETKAYPEIMTFRLPAWLFIILFRWLYTHNQSMQRFTAHAADGLQEAKENYESIVNTAHALTFAMPHMTALGVFLQGV